MRTSRNEITKLGQGRVRQAWTVAQTPLRCVRRRHPQRKVIPMPIGIGDNDNRFAAMRPVFQRRCPDSSEEDENGNWTVTVSSFTLPHPCEQGAGAG